MAGYKTVLNKIWSFSLFLLEVLFCLMAIVFITYAVMNIASGTKVIKIFGFQHFVIQSESMTPVLDYGDVVVIRKIHSGELHPNDIISFYADINHDGQKEIVTHHYVSTELTESGETIIRTKPETSINLDSWRIPEEDLIGKYIFHLNKIGKAIMYLKSSLGIRVLIMDIIIIYVLIILIHDKDDEEADKSGTDPQLTEK